MSRRGSRKKESGLKLWFPIVCIIIVGITFFMLHDIQGKVEKMKQNNTLNNNSIKNTTSQELIQNNVEEENTVVENTVTNTVTNLVKNEIANETTNDTASNTTNSTSNNDKSNDSKLNGAGITDKKQIAIELVKEKWGEDDTVDFMFDYVNEDDEYVIAVKDKNSATIKCYFRVDIDTKTVELD